MCHCLIISLYAPCIIRESVAFVNTFVDISIKTEEICENNGKKRLKQVLIAAIFVFIISTISFALGYVSNTEINQTPIIIEKCS